MKTPWTAKNLLKAFILVGIVRPLIWFFMGLNRYSRFRELPRSGPLVLALNHNSHLDTLVLFALLPLHVALRTSIVAAGDYFTGFPLVSWFLFDLWEMVPIWRDRSGGHLDPLDTMSSVLRAGRVLALYPEGTRGMPEERSELKRGVTRLMSRFPNVPIVPIYFRGLGKSLPRNGKIFIPLIPQVKVGAPITSRRRAEESVLADLRASFDSLEASMHHDWVQP